MDLDFLRSIIISQAWYQIMSEHNNIPDPGINIVNGFLDCGMDRKERVMGNSIVHVVNAWDLKGEE